MYVYYLAYFDYTKPNLEIETTYPKPFQDEFEYFILFIIWDLKAVLNDTNDIYH